MLSSRVALLTAVGATVLAPSRTVRAQGPVNVIITLRGDVGQYAGMCGSHGGEDKLTGKLALVSYDAEDGTALYQGALDRKTAVDACGTEPNPTEDQVKMCFAHLDGSARMNVTLEVYEDDRGAWVKSNPLSGPGLPVTKKITGCAEAGEWLNAYPGDGIMSGLSFEDVPSGYLQARRYGTQELELVVAKP
jgi:hypothetical protein